MSSITVTVGQIAKILGESKFEDLKLGTKSTVVLCTLPNGFQIIESSSCVDPANYDHGLGVDLCKKRIADKLWVLEGYVLQQRVHENTNGKGVAR